MLLTGLCRAAVMTAVADELAGRPMPAATDRQLLRAGYSAALRGLAAVVVDPWRVAGRRCAPSSPNC